MLSAYASILSAVVPIFLLLLVGWSFRERDWLKAQADDSLRVLIVNVFAPCLIFSFIAGNEAVKDPVNLGLPPILGFLSIAGGFALAYAAGKWFGLEVGTGRRTFAFTSGIYNYGFVPIPLLIALFPGDTGTLGVLMVFNVGVEIAIWSIGIVLISGKLTRDSFKQLLNPPLMAVLLALLTNFVGLDPHIPLWFDRLLEMLGYCYIPLGIILAGAILADHTTQTGLLRPFRIPAAACLFRLLLIPMLLILPALAFELSEEMTKILIIQAAMPAGIFPLVLTRHFGGDTKVAVQVILTTTLVSLITIPLWIVFGLWITGLV